MSTLQDTAKDAIRETADAVRHGASDAMATGRDALGRVQTEAKDMAASVVSGLRDEAGNRAEALKDGIAEEGAAFADTLRRAAEDGEGDTLPSRMLSMLADGVTDLADGLRGRSFDEAVADVTDYARRNPGVFVAAAALAGFAIVRFARASGASKAPFASGRVPTSDPFELGTS